MPHDIIDLRFFVTITETGSLAEAARPPGVSPSPLLPPARQLGGPLGQGVAPGKIRRDRDVPL